MGYYSNVRIRTTNKGYEIMKGAVKEYLEKALKENKISDIEVNNLLNEEYESDFDFEDNQVTLKFDDVKWYDCYYEDVNAVMYAIDKVKEKNIDIIYARIGEDYDDVELCERVINNDIDYIDIYPANFGD